MEWCDGVVFLRLRFPPPETVESSPGHEAVFVGGGGGLRSMLVWSVKPVWAATKVIAYVFYFLFIFL